MSQEKKMEVMLKKEDRDLLKSAIEQVGKVLSEKKPPFSHEAADDKDSAPSHQTIEELIGCPDCYPKILKAVVEKEFKEADHECEECGLPVKKEEADKPEWKCLSCGHGYAKPK